MSKVFYAALLVLFLATVFVIQTREISSAYVACYDDIRGKIFFDDIKYEKQDWIKSEYCAHSYDTIKTYKYCSDSISKEHSEIPKEILTISYNLGKLMRPPMLSAKEFIILHNEACEPISKIEVPLDL